MTPWGPFIYKDLLPKHVMDLFPPTAAFLPPTAVSASPGQEEPLSPAGRPRWEAQVPEGSTTFSPSGSRLHFVAVLLNTENPEPLGRQANGTFLSCHLENDSHRTTLAQDSVGTQRLMKGTSPQGPGKDYQKQHP